MEMMVTGWFGCRVWRAFYTAMAADDDWPHALNDGSLPGDLIQSNSIPAVMMTEYYRVRLGIVMSRPAG